MIFKKILMVIAGLSFTFTGAAHAQFFTGGLNFNSDDSTPSYNANTLTLDATSILGAGTGTFLSVPAASFSLATNTVITLNGANTVTFPISSLPTFEVSSLGFVAGTNPTDEFTFEMTSITPQASPGVFKGTAEWIDNRPAGPDFTPLTTTPAIFTLSFSGPNVYSFSDAALAVPEPSAWSLTLGIFAVFAFWRIRLRRA
jgi:hypothetical protein